jgi:uncharacterized membrane protein HdeD (DUF308 family)
MSIDSISALENPLRIGLHQLRRNWGWILAAGLCLILLGAVALSTVKFFTFGYVLYMGLLLMGSGIVGAIYAFQVRQWSGFFLALLVSVLDFIVGLLIVTHTGPTAVIMTLLLAAFFFVGGIFRLVASTMMQFPGWIWSALSGLVAILLGAAVWKQWPWDSMWVIGLFIGIELAVRGWSLVMFALMLRARVPALAK